MDDWSSKLRRKTNEKKKVNRNYMMALIGYKV